MGVNCQDCSGTCGCSTGNRDRRRDFRAVVQQLLADPLIQAAMERLAPVDVSEEYMLIQNAGAIR